jgi:translation initiation factor IF-2
MENGELISLLKDRGYVVKSASSTVDNISAESLMVEFGGTEEVATPDDSKFETVEVSKSSVESNDAIIRTREEIEIDRRERDEALKKDKVAFNPPPAPPVVPSFKAPPAVVVPIGGVRKPTARAPIAKEETAFPSDAQAVSVIRPEIAVTAKPSASVEPPVIQVPTVKPVVSAPPSIQLPTPTPPASAAPRVVMPGRPVSSPPQVPTNAPRPVTMPRGVTTPPLPSRPEAAPVPAAASDASDSAAQKIQIKPPIIVRDFAIQIGKKPFQLISELMEMNIFASMNQIIEEDVARRIAEKNGFVLDIRHRGESQPQIKKEPVEKPKAVVKNLDPRPPVVCILGHVDHGKTTLLDTIRKTNVVATEAGGITQHIGAYQIEHKSRKITFIDTPGHAAFSNMRARGANVTDIAILVVAADDGFMPQTDEAFKHAKTANVPVVVAINKMDAPGANIDRVKRQMQERGIAPEDWGGETLCAPVSALKVKGIDELLDMVLLQADVIESIQADYKCAAEGMVIEAQKEIGRGSTATVIVQQGILKKGDALVCGSAYCKVRSLIDDSGREIKSAPPATPVKIIGWTGSPDAGDHFVTYKNEKEAKRVAEENEYKIKMLLNAQKEANASKSAATVEDLFAAIAQSQQKTFHVLVKADVYGAAEALAHSLQQIKSDKIRLNVVDVGVGAVSKNDIIMAGATKSVVVAFNTGIEVGVAPIAKHQGIKIFSHNIIYELIGIIKDAMADCLEPELRENKIGAAAIRQVFALAKGAVAGCMITEGKVVRMGVARLLRKGSVIHEGKIVTLKRFKDDATEVRAGYECGIRLDGFDAYEEGDQIEAFEILKIKAAL